MIAPRVFPCFLTILSVLVADCCRSEDPAPDRDRISQVSIINALLLGEYDGRVSMGELLRMGDFGLGTCDHLDGELIVLDGVAYQVRSDGTVRRLPPETTTPFAVVTFFDADAQRDCPPMTSLQQLEQFLDEAIPGREQFVALRIEGDFSRLTLRSVPRQEPPYRPLAEVAREQTEWTLNDMRGTMIAVRSPRWVTGISVPGYHWHFLSADHAHGGHMLDCRIKSGTVTWDDCRSWLVELPRDSAAHSDFSRDLSRELEQVEKERRGD